MAKFNLAYAYAKFRGSKTFLVLLVSFIATWMTLHFVLGMDGDLGGLNTFLSTEASVSLAFFTMVADAQATAQTAQTKDIEQLARATLTIAEAIRDMLAEQKEKEQPCKPQ
jgi:hypothetical protein